MSTQVEQKVTLFNLSIIIAVCMASLSYGYSFSIVSTTLGQPAWFAYFGLTQDPTNDRYNFTNSIIGTMNGLFSVGGLLGSGFVAWSCDGLGRKRSLAIACPIGIIGGAFQGGAVHIGMFLVGRLLSGFAVGIFVVTAPLFQSEIAPPAARGFLVAQHGVVLVVGYSLAAWIGVASYFSRQPSFQWRFPLALQVLWPLSMFILIPLLPESPRWLLMQGREDEALKIVMRLHARNDPSSPAARFAREEYQQMKLQVQADKANSTSERLMSLFERPSYRKRIICAFIVMFGSQGTGILVVYNYSVLLYQGLGFSGSLPLILAATYVTVACVGNAINSILIDKIGRVRLLVIGWTGCLTSLVVLTALTATYVGKTNEAGLRAGVFAMFLYISFYGCCVDATSYVYVSEIFPTHIRSKGVAFALSVLFLSTVAYLIPAPNAFVHIHWKYYLVFIALTAINTPVAYWYLPETNGLTLEEINERFGDEVVLHITHMSETDREVLNEKMEEEATTAHCEKGTKA